MPVVQRISDRTWTLNGIHLVSWRRHGFVTAYTHAGGTQIAATVWGAGSRALEVLRLMGRP